MATSAGKAKTETAQTNLESKKSPVIPGKINIEAINKTNGFTPRVKAIRERYTKSVSKVSSDRNWYMMQSYKQTEGQHPEVRRAKAFANVWDNMSIKIFDYDLIIGNWTDHVRGAHPRIEDYAEEMRVLLETNEAAWTNSQGCEASLSTEDFGKLLEAAKYWEKHYPGPEVREHWEKLVKEVDPDDLLREFGYTGIRISPEFRPKGKRFKQMPQAPRPQANGGDYEKVLKIGYRGFIKEAKDHINRIEESGRGRDFTREEKDKLGFLNGVVIVLEGAIRLAKRYAHLAEEMAAKEKDPQRKAELEKAAEVCMRVPANPARNFHEALQSIWFTALNLHMDKAQPNVALGRFDQYTFPYYMDSINEGQMTRQEAAEIFGCFIMKLTELEPYMTPAHRALSQGTNYENITIGGCDIHGRDASNEMSCLVLHVVKDLKTHQPYISLRCNTKMASELWDKAFECARVHGAGIPAFFNDTVDIEYMLGRGHTIEHARDHAIVGCINAVYPKTMGWMGAPITLTNMAKVLEITLHNGRDPRTGIGIGPKTGDARKFKTFEKLREAFIKNMEWVLNSQMDIYQGYENGGVPFNGWTYPFLSAVLEGCIENGRDVTRLGASVTIDDPHYSLDRFMQDASDSLIAVKKLVFEQKKYTMDQIITAIDANWEGYDQIRADCLAQPKYGNDDDEADELFNELWSLNTDIVMRRKDVIGRHYIVYRQGSSMAQTSGKYTGALPNGRVAGEWLSDASLSPVQTMDRKGPTAVINSVTKIDTTHMNGTLLNMKLCPSLMDKPGGMMKFKQLVKTFMDKGGQEVQFNILDKEKLLDAQKNPQNYRDLVVRVAGYSAFWVDLEQQVQDEIIRRTEHEM